MTPTLHNEPFDLAVKDVYTAETLYVQIKTARTYVDKDGVEWYNVDGNSNGKVYTLDEVDVFVAVDGDDMYIFDNEEELEYRVEKSRAEEFWIKL